ncbi:MAG: ABC transporter permease [Pedosphaera sp.]|nr:ABC transporter permease [Pedosphaera sp.]
MIQNVYMNRRLLVRRSLSFHFRSHLGVGLGAAVASIILVGALVVGDSVRGTLRQRSLNRTGHIAALLDSRDRFFEARPGGPAGTNQSHLSSYALRLPAVAVRQEGAARANQVVLYGVPDSFWGLAPRSGRVGPSGENVFLNEALAGHLSARVGDQLLLRIHKPTALSQDAVISPRDRATVAIRVTVERILSAAELGDVGFQASQSIPFNAFVPHERLALAAGVTGRANLALVGLDVNGGGTVELAQRVRSGFTLADAELDVRLVPKVGQLIGRQEEESNVVELVTRRIFIDPTVSAVASQLPSLSSAVPLLTYLANSIEAGEKSVPYSMVTAVGAPYTPKDLGDDEIMVNEWLAGRLRVKVGDSVRVIYYRVDGGVRLVEQTNLFRVRGVVPLRGLYADRTLMPEFPGLTKAESTRDWDAGFELSRPIDEEDEAYWKAWRGTPKAFVTLAAGRAMWGNRFGDATAIRWFTPDLEKGRAVMGSVGLGLRTGVDPVKIGLRFESVRESAKAAAEGGQDFGGLFIGFSLFLIVSAVLLTSLLFRFGLERRTTEIGTYLALGWPPVRVGMLYLREGSLVAIAGALLGGLGGWAYGWAVIYGLNTLWSDAVAGAHLNFLPTLPSTLGGALGAVGVAIAAQAWTLRTVMRRPTLALLNEGASEIPSVAKRSPRSWTSIVFIGGGGLAALAGRTAEASSQPGVFFGAGFLVLTGVLVGFRHRVQSTVNQPQASTLANVIARAAASQPGRSTAVVALLAIAVFLIVVVAANRLDASRDAAQRGSGTGGFALWASSSLPLVENLNTDRGLEKLGLNPKKLQGVAVIPFRVRDGDEASCLNLNRAQRPRLLGVDPALLDERGAFTFKELIAGANPLLPWKSLTRGELYLLQGPQLAADEVAAIGDANSIQWALGKKVGDTIDSVDEQGRPFRLRLVGAVANSILQGQLLIAESEFVRRFPRETGYRTFLVDATHDTRQAAEELTRGLADFGFETEATVVRLNRFNAVQNTYLNTFQMLGGLGLILGIIGLGLVVLRNVQERRGELGLLMAVGFSAGRLQSMVLREHLRLLWAGLIVGGGSALLAILPSLNLLGAGLPWKSIGWILGGVICNGLFWTWLATRGACRGNLLASLRGE